jgi:tetratricopeptide (TPR) repeat protein
LINTYADKALLLDPQLAQSLIAKAAYFLNIGEHSEALPYLERALEYNPNSTLVINILSEYYTSYDPNIKKYLEYALLGLKLEFPSSDSISASYSYLHIANAFIQAGFVDQAEKYINKSLVYNPDNLYSAYVKAFILYAKENDLEQTKELLIEALKKDSTRLDILQEVAKIYYFMRDYESAYRYYAKFNWARDTYGLSIYPAENSKIAVVYSEMGMIEEYEDYFERFRKYSESNNSIYKELNYVEYYSYIGQSDKAIEALRKFSKETDYNYWIITFFEMDPLLDNIRDNPEFIKLMEEIENKFWKNHEQIRSSLVKKGLI